MKLRNMAMIRGLGLAGAWFVRGLIGSLSYKIDGGPWGHHPTDPREQQNIYCFWHETLLLPTIFRQPFHVLISQHADGELIAQMCRHMRYNVVRGSSKRGGVSAVRELMQVENSHLFITPDGPRGPRRQVQMGVSFLGMRTGLPIYPMGVGFGKCWRAQSWDRFAVPCPYSRARIVVGDPVHVPAGLDRKDLEHYRLVIEQRMLRATEDAELWALGKPRLIRAFPQTLPPLQAQSA